MVEDLLEFLLVGDEEFSESFEGVELGHGKDVLVGFSPLEIIKPICWILLNLNLALWSGEEESQLCGVHLVVALENFDSHGE